MVRNESRSNATPRLGWSGAEELATPALSDETLSFLYKLLGGPHSSIEKVGTKIRELGASYHRYLHQDEFGPTRAEQMSALRAALASIVKLDSLILVLPEHLALDLMKNFEGQPGLRSWAIGQIHHSANTELFSRHSHHSTYDLKLLQSICAAAKAAIDLISSLDTNSESELLTDTLATGLLMVKDVFSVVDAWLHCRLRLRRRWTDCGANLAPKKNCRLGGLFRSSAICGRRRRDGL